jgi:hypothetical protein
VWSLVASGRGRDGVAGLSDVVGLRVGSRVGRGIGCQATAFDLLQACGLRVASAALVPGRSLRDSLRARVAATAFGPGQRLQVRRLERSGTQRERPRPLGVVTLARADRA